MIGSGLILMVGSQCFAIFASKTPNQATGETWIVFLFAKHGGGFRYFTPLACIAVWAGTLAGAAIIVLANYLWPKPDQGTGLAR